MLDGAGDAVSVSFCVWRGMRDAFEHNLGGGLYRSSMHMRSNANEDGLCTHSGDGFRPQVGDGFRPQIGSDCVSKFAHFVASAFEGVPKVGTDSVPRFGDENRPHNNETCFGYEKRSSFEVRISSPVWGRVCIRAVAVESVCALLLGSQRDWFLGGAAHLRPGWERASTKAVVGVNSESESALNSCPSFYLSDSEFICAQKI